MPEPDLLRLLAVGFKGARTELQRRLEPHGVHAGQDLLLDLLWREGRLPVGVIAERLGLEVPTVVRTVERMGATGLVTKERDPSDRRRSLVALTERGRAVEPAVRAARAEVVSLAAGDLPPAEVATLERLLREVRQNLGGER